MPTGVYTLNGRQQALDATDVTHLSLHDGYPDDAGSNEKSGAGYARQALTLGATDANGVKTQTGTETFSLTGNVNWVGGWTAVSGGSMRNRWPLGGEAKEYDVDPHNDEFYEVGHGRSDNDKIVFFGSSTPGGLNVGTIYYVRDALTDTYKVTDAPGNAALNITSKPSTADAVCSRIDESNGGARTIDVSGVFLTLNH